MKNNSHTVISDLFSRLSAKLITFTFHRSYVLALLINFSVVDAMLPIMTKHLGISALTGKRVKGDDFAIKEHLLFCKYAPDFEDFSILPTNNNDLKVTLMESSNQ